MCGAGYTNRSIYIVFYRYIQQCSMYISPYVFIFIFRIDISPYVLTVRLLACRIVVAVGYQLLPCSRCHRALTTFSGPASGHPGRVRAALARPPNWRLFWPSAHYVVHLSVGRLVAPVFFFYIFMLPAVLDF